MHYARLEFLEVEPGAKMWMPGRNWGMNLVGQSMIGWDWTEAGDPAGCDLEWSQLHVRLQEVKSSVMLCSWGQRCNSQGVVFVGFQARCRKSQPTCAKGT